MPEEQTHKHTKCQRQKHALPIATRHSGWTYLEELVQKQMFVAVFRFFGKLGFSHASVCVCVSVCAGKMSEVIKVMAGHCGTTSMVWPAHQGLRHTIP